MRIGPLFGLWSGAGAPLAFLAAVFSAATSAAADDFAYGRRLYLDKAQCSYCHGWAADGAGEPQSNGGAANLRQSFLNREQLIEVIMCGRPGTPMPHYDEAAYTDNRCYGMTEAELGTSVAGLAAGRNLAEARGRGHCRLSAGEIHRPRRGHAGGMRRGLRRRRPRVRSISGQALEHLQEIGRGVMRHVDRFLQAIPVFYLVWALPLLLALSVLIPPAQQPDEPAHFLRTVQIAGGSLFGHRVGGSAGGPADTAVMPALAPFFPAFFHPEVKITSAMYAASNSIRWAGKTQVQEFPNVAIFPPLMYAPGVLAVWVGRTLDLTVVRTLHLVRVTNALAAVLVTFLALAAARRTRCALAALAALPMTLALDVSASHDALMIALVFLAVGMIDRVVDEGRDATGLETALIAAALALPAMARPPYVALSALLLLTGPIRSLRPWAGAAAVGAATCAWWIYTAMFSLTRLAPADPSAQWELVKADPTLIVAVLWRTLVREWMALGEQLVGKLGWLDTRLPTFFILVAAGVLILTFLSATAGPARRPWLPAVAVLAGVLIMGVSFYFVQSPPGFPIVAGLQGRYFLPFAAASALAFPACRRSGDGSCRSPPQRSPSWRSAVPWLSSTPW